MAVDSYDAICERDSVLMCVMQNSNWSDRPSGAYSNKFYRWEFMNFYNARQWIQKNCSNFVDQGTDQLIYLASNKKIKYYTAESLLEQADPSWRDAHANVSQFYNRYYFRALSTDQHKWRVIKSMMALLIEVAIPVGVVAGLEERWYVNTATPTDPPSVSNSCFIDVDDLCYCKYPGSGTFPASLANSIGGYMGYEMDKYQYYEDGEVTEVESSRGDYHYALSSKHYASITAPFALTGMLRTAYVNQEGSIGDRTYTHVLASNTVTGVYETHEATRAYVQAATNMAAFVVPFAVTNYTISSTNFPWIATVNTEVHHELQADGTGWPVVEYYMKNYYYDPYSIEMQASYILLRPNLEFK